MKYCREQNDNHGRGCVQTQKRQQSRNIDMDVKNTAKEVAERKHNDVDVYKTAKEVAEKKHTEVDVY